MTLSPQEIPVVPITDSHLENTRELYGDKIAALDGNIGHVRDFYFDDNIWVIRYAIADTGSWLPGRLVLLSPHAFGKLDQHKKTLHINLQRIQIENSPPIESQKPVSRQYEADYYSYYGWPVYWSGGGLWGLTGYPGIRPPSEAEVESLRRYHHRDDKHLRSAQEVTGYHIETAGGEIGRVSGFMVDDRSWAIPELVVEAGRWYSGKEIRIPTDKVDRISYSDSKVVVSLTKADIEKTTENHLARASSEKPSEKNIHI
jgi:sporulation protein YlmC with PRC-barrel domain